MTNVESQNINNALARLSEKLQKVPDIDGYNKDASIVYMNLANAYKAIRDAVSKAEGK